MRRDDAERTWKFIEDDHVVHVVNDLDFVNAKPTGPTTGMQSEKNPVSSGPRFTRNFSAPGLITGPSPTGVPPRPPPPGAEP